MMNNLSLGSLSLLGWEERREGKKNEERGRREKRKEGFQKTSQIESPMKWVDACLGEKWEKREVLFIGGELASPFFSLAVSL